MSNTLLIMLYPPIFNLLQFTDKYILIHFFRSPSCFKFITNFKLNEHNNYEKIKNDYNKGRTHSFINIYLSVNCNSKF